MHVHSKSKSSDSSSSSHHARKWRTAPISRIELVFILTCRTLLLAIDGLFYTGKKYLVNFSQKYQEKKTFVSQGKGTPGQLFYLPSKTKKKMGLLKRLVSTVMFTKKVRNKSCS